MSHLGFLPSFCVRAAVLLMLLAVLTGAPALAQGSQPANCGDAQDFEIGFRSNSGADFIVVWKDLKTGVADSTYAGPSIGEHHDGCHWVGVVSPPVANETYIAPNVPYALLFRQLESGPESDVERTYPYTYFYCADPDGVLAGSFYCPFGDVDGNDTDLLLFHEADGRLRVAPTALGSIPGGGQDVNEAFTDDRWVLPYYAERVCRHFSGAACPLGSPGSPDYVNRLPFLTPQVGPAYSLTRDEDFLVPAGKSWTWRASDSVTALRFPQSRKLVTRGTLNVNGLTFTAADAAQGWGGVRFAASSTGALTGTTVSGVRCYLSACKGVAAVEAYNADLTLTSNSFIQDNPSVGGLGVFGTSGWATVTGSRIQNNGQAGVGVGSGGVLSVEGESFVQLNGWRGVWSTGTGSHAYLHTANVLDNDAVGVAATGYGAVTFERPPPAAPEPLSEFVNGNVGGLLADGGGNIRAGNFAFRECYACNNNLEDNFTAAFDAKSINGSTLMAEKGYWGVGRTLPSHLSLTTDGSSVLEVEPLLTAPPSFGGGGGSAALAGDGGVLYARTGVGIEVPGDTTLGAVHALVLHVLEAEADGRPEDALALLAEALPLAATDDERRLAYNAATRMLYYTPSAAFTAGLEVEAAAGGASAPWALRALTAAYAGSGEVAAAKEAATALTTGGGDASADSTDEHARFGYAMLARLAVETGDEASASEAVATLVSVWPASDEAAEAATLLRLAFGEAAPLGRFAGAHVAPSAPNEAEAAPADEFRLYAARPNPSRGAATVAFDLGAPSRVRLALYDALGREVALLAEGPFEAGRHEAILDASVLAPGVYVLRVVVEPAGGVARTLTRRLTLLR